MRHLPASILLCCLGLLPACADLSPRVAAPTSRPTEGADERAPADEAAAAGANACPPEPACYAGGALDLAPGPMRPWTHGGSGLVSRLGANHRGHDILVADGQEQWLIGKFAYGVTDKDLVGEEVDVFVERGCAGSWERLGTVVTSRKGEHVPVDGVWDTGGRVYFAIPREKALGLGRHRVRFVVAGDHSHADLFVDVVPPAAPIFVSDVDGTLTSSESAEVFKLLTGGLPKAQPGAAAALSALAAKGYRPVYLTARPEWLLERTRAFLAANGFPAGVIRTTVGVTGTSGKTAAAFKSAELAALRTKGFTIGWAFGNQPSDAEAYEAADVAPRDHRVFLRLHDPHGGRRIEQYRELFVAFSSAPAVCR